MSKFKGEKFHRNSCIAEKKKVLDVKNLYGFSFWINGTVITAHADDVRTRKKKKKIIN